MSRDREEGSGADGAGTDGARKPAGGEGEPGGESEAAREEGERPRSHAADASLHSDELPDSVRCPHCGETDSEQFSAFGSAVSVSQFYCRSCRTVFEYFKWR